MKLHSLLLFVLVLFNLEAYAQKTACVVVRDAKTNDPIESVAVLLTRNESNDSLLGSTDRNGYLHLNADFDIHSLKLLHPNYSASTITPSNSSRCGEFQMHVKVLQFDKIKIKSQLLDKSPGTTIINREYLDQMPFIFGEKEIFKAVQTLPGVSTSFEANSGLYIRGGNTDQTSILLDDAPIYNIGHFFGFFSPFDGEIVRSFKLQNSGIDASYGGQGASVLDVRLREGDTSAHKGSFGIGLLTSKASLEGPIIKNKLSYVTSFRFAYPALLFSINKNSFWDGNIKLKYQINPNSTLYFSTFASNDRISWSDVNEYFTGALDISTYKWGNNTYNLRLNHINKKGNFINQSLSFSRYASNVIFDINSGLSLRNRMRNLNYLLESNKKTKFLFIKRFGLHASYFNDRSPYFTTPEGDSSILNNTKALSLVVFSEHKINLSKLLSLNINNRLGMYVNLVDQFNQPIFEPRLMLKYEKFKQGVFYAFDKTSQYRNYVGNRQVSVPGDLWIQADRTFTPQKTFSNTIGVFKKWKNTKYTIEAFHRTYKNALDIKDGGKIFGNPDALKEVIKVNAQAYGLEFMLERKINKFRTQLSYTLSRSIRKSDSINSKGWFAANFDRTHVCNLNLFYNTRNKWTFSALLIIQSGVPFTAQYAYTFLYSTRNEYRLPVYKRLDFSATKKFIWLKTDCELNFSVFNITFSKNLTSQYPAFNLAGSLPIIPSCSFIVHF